MESMSKINKRIVVFLLATFGLMYLSHGLIAILLNMNLVEWDNFPLNLLSIIGGGAPAFAALLIVYKMYNKKEQEGYWKKVFLLKVHWFWWVIAIISPFLIGLISNIVYKGGWFYPEIDMMNILMFPVSLAFMVFAGGAEELGWRGILQEKLSKKQNLIVTGIVIGVLWGVWHLPLFLIDVFAHYEYAFSTYMFSTVIYSLLLTLVFYKTGSVMLAIVMHASINAFGNLGFRIPMEVHGGLWVLFVILFIIFASILYLVEKK